VEVVLACTLRRRKGSPIAARTVDLGAEGMRISSPRPLALDEWLLFEIDADGGRVEGQACVLREEPLSVYGLRFERLAPPVAERLRGLTG